MKDVSMECSPHKLLGHPAKVASMLAVLRHEIPVDRTPPICVEVHLTDVCNMRCRWCIEAPKRGKRILDPKVARRLVRDLSSIGAGVVFDGGGEPTLYPGFEAFVEYAPANSFLGLITNGLTFPPSLTSAFRWIRFSIDAGSRAGYLHEKGVDAYERVWRVVRAAVRSGPKTVVAAAFVLTSRNAEEIDSFVKRASSSGVTYVYMRLVEGHPRMRASVDDLERIEERAKLAASKSGVTLVWRGTERLQLGNGGLPCIAHSVTCIVRSDAQVYLCEKHEPPLPIADLRTASFREAWHGNARAAASARVLSSEVCRRHCGVCRIAPLNRLLEGVDACVTSNFI